MRSAALALLLLLTATAAFPCSTFCLSRDGEAVFGRNYDFEIGYGFVMTNARGAAKRSYLGTTSWISKYGSVTINQFGKGLPMDGMNEAGLAVALMWLDETVYPPVDARPALTVLEWIQYQLDNYGSVAEVLANAESVRISNGGTPLHYLIGDATGAAATIEYLEGRLVVHTGETLPTANLTNHSYSDSVRYLQGRRTAPSGSGSLERFARTSMMMRNARTEDAFSILRSVAQPGSTRWSAVYDMKRRRVDWVTSNEPSRKSVAFSDLDFACTASAKMAPVDTGVFTDYSPAENLELIARSYAGTSFLRGASRASIERDARYSDSWTCAPSRARAVRK